MKLVSAKLLRSEGRYWHWCPGCNGLHPLPDEGWTFDGKLECPSFTPSFKHTLRRGICHYILTAGVLRYQADCFHGLARSDVPLPDLPQGAIDDPYGETMSKGY